MSEPNPFDTELSEHPNDTLPQAWVWSTLGEVCEGSQYGWTTSATSEGTLHLLRTTDITSGQIDWHSVPYCREEPPDIDKYLLHDGDIVISRAGSVGFSHLIKSPQYAVFASYLIRFKPLINARYVSYFLRSPSFWHSISQSSVGIAIPNVNASKLRQIAIPVAPLAEQQRIVAKIEELFTRLDAGVATLKRVQVALKRYKASVLKAACEGRLVPQDPNDEPASRLLERILSERRAKWEAEKRAKGKDPQKARYEEPQSLDEDGLTELPRSWVWTTIDQIISMLQYGTSVKAESDETSGVAVLRMGNLQEGRIHYSNLKFIDRNKEDASKYQLVDGDILINRTNSAELVGKAGLFSRDGQFIFASYLIRLRVQSVAVIPRYLVACINSDIGRRHIDKVKHQVAGQANINSQNIREMPVPLPPISEQQRITEEIDRRLSVLQELEAIVDTNLVRAERLRQSILKRAFEGRLAAHNRHDEPAGALLEKIRAERA